MELEQLKTIWDKTSKAEVARYRVNDRAIRAMIGKKSETTVSNVKRTMLQKLWMAGVSGILSIVMAVVHLVPFTEEPLFWETMLTNNEAGFIFMTVGILLAVISIFNYINYRRIEEFEQSNEPLKHTLVRIIEIIGIKIKLTLYSDLAFTPLIVGFVAYIYIFQREGFGFDLRLLYLLLIVAGVAAFSYFTNKRIMKRKFGDDMDRLKGYLSELESLDE